MRIGSLLLVAGALVMCCAQAVAQALPSAARRSPATLRAFQPDTRSLVESPLTLRPAPGLEDLAARVAAVLEVRASGPVAVGDAPPPGMAEAVPRDHLALVRNEEGIRIVLGASDGLSMEAVVRLESISGMQEARAVALAAESLRDDAALAARRSAVAPTDGGGVRPGESDLPPGGEQPKGEPQGPHPSEPTVSRPQPRSADGGLPHDGRLVDTLPELEPLRASIGGGLLEDVELFGYGQMYTGASSFSTSLQAGAAAGGGVCAVGHCLLLNMGLPLTQGDANDLRYRYLTFYAMFLSRPLSFGDFTPGAGIGLLSRVGRFEADMGLEDAGVQTDLGARALLELGYAVGRHVEVLAEAGVDLALDRLRVDSGDTARRRGDRWMPWVQAGLRMHP